MATDAIRTTATPGEPRLTIRALNRPADYPGMNAIANAMREADGLGSSTTDESFANFYDHLENCDPDRDVIVAERDGRIAGYGRTAWRRVLDGPLLFEVIVFADPDDFDAFAGLFDSTEARAIELAAGHEAPDKVLETFAGDRASERSQLIDARGYEPIRHEYMMVRPNLDDLDAPLPEGLEIRDVRPEHLRQIWEAEAEAFRDHWGYSEPTEATWEAFRNDPVQGDASLWRVAWDGDQVAGMVRSFINPADNERFKRKRGWVENISVRRPWRRRGLARALIAASFPLLRARGMTEGALGVDTENTSGALRVYESCGFRPVSRTTTYRKSIA
jgi:ribosomal protein S18 acetylase RimI-like enzyme